jgi:hypothetical protein
VHGVGRVRPGIETAVFQRARPLWKLLIRAEAALVKEECRSIAQIDRILRLFLGAGFIKEVRNRMVSILYTCLYTHAYTHAHTHAYTHAYTHVYTHAYTHVYTHVYTHAYTHAYTHVYMHVYTHVYTRVYRGDFLRAAGCGIGAGGPKNKYLPICVISPAFLPQNPT